jgi:hypothetical protein
MLLYAFTTFSVAYLEILFSGSANEIASCPGFLTVLCRKAVVLLLPQASLEAEKREEHTTAKSLKTTT